MWSYVYAGRDFRSIATALAGIHPLLGDLRCALDERRPMVDFDFRASGARLDDFAVNCRLLRPSWMTSSVSGESLRCLRKDFVRDLGLLVALAAFMYGCR